MSRTVNFDGQQRAPRATETLADGYMGTSAAALAALPGLLNTLATTITGWSGAPTTAQTALAVTDAQAIADTLEHVHFYTNKLRNGA